MLKSECDVCDYTSSLSFLQFVFGKEFNVFVVLQERNDSIQDRIKSIVSSHGSEHSIYV